MFTRNEPFIISMKPVLKATGWSVFKTNPWKVGDVVVVDQIGISKNGTVPKTVHIGVSRDENIIYYTSVIISATLTYYNTKTPIVIPSGNRLAFRLSSDFMTTDYNISIMGHIETLVNE